MNSIAFRTKLLSTLRQHINDRQWLGGCLIEGQEMFPYEIEEQHKTSLLKGEITPDNQCDFLPKGLSKKRVYYIINMPLVYREDSSLKETIEKILGLLKKESFANGAEVPSRLAIVIGINRIKSSIDPEINDKFKRDIKNLPKINDIAFRCFGFQWGEHNWSVKKKYMRVQEKISSPKKAYKLLKIINKPLADKTRIANERKIAVPYQQIRERIKDSPHTAQLAEHFLTLMHNQYLYYATMDADCEKLDSGKGFFTKFDHLLAKRKYVSVASLGYCLREDEYPLLKLAVEIDMKIREAIAHIFPFGPYFPEQSTVFRVCGPNRKNHLSELSFIGRGNNLESRRLIQNGLADGVFDRRSCFLAQGELVTRTPKRMYTESIKKIAQLTPNLLKEKRSLQALRGVSQSHLFPKQWADNIYVFLDLNVDKVTKATTPMMHIFAVFDPISRMFADFDKAEKYSRKKFDAVIKTYDNPLSENLNNTLESAKNRLLAIGVPNATVNRIVKAAEKSGRAVKDILARYVESDNQ